MSSVDLLASGGRQIFDFELAGSDRREAEDAAIVNSDVGRAEAMLERVLASEPAKEAIVGFIPRLKR